MRFNHKELEKNQQTHASMTRVRALWPEQEEDSRMIEEGALYTIQYYMAEPESAKTPLPLACPMVMSWVLDPVVHEESRMLDEGAMYAVMYYNKSCQEQGD
ncbi:hypothetical protein B0H94_103167 [Salsuginibacillus halophilus]|uniref:Uncharacterized protein n=1 Tax=Salsuginibacillus halophilus TaxID=517424 RepID=A0A2P8HWL8_9BACI|nr:hypothetical protein [Salsuginibacillus halophilus]PSL50555.1 hypothetical protein B0H94_103167 [Salsuginibacillus halophilus]